MFEERQLVGFLFHSYIQLLGCHRADHMTKVRSEENGVDTDGLEARAQESFLLY